LRIGIGYDIHKLVEGRKLILGGVQIDYEKGLLGHSDADVLVHAIMDAILGAIGKRDIGCYFPDTDKNFKDINSLLLLEKVAEILKSSGYKIENIDSVIIAQAPKLNPYIDEMKSNIAQVLKLDISQIGIKATTNEGLDSIGELKAIASQAVVLVG
jgi:2-C-methyl-D-erythritol 2,4-cyclodiphosphate synthase